MATPVRNLSPWSREASPIYAPGASTFGVFAPGAFASRVFASDFIIRSDQKITMFEIKPFFRHAIGPTTFGHLSTSFSHEGSHLAEYFEKICSKKYGRSCRPVCNHDGRGPIRIS